MMVYITNVKILYFTIMNFGSLISLYKNRLKRDENIIDISNLNFKGDLADIDMNFIIFFELALNIFLLW